MRISFEGDSLVAPYTVIGNTPKDYIALIDTGATKSAIPLNDCGALGLQYSGDYNPTTATGVQTFPMFDAIIEVDGRRFDLQIMGLSIPIAILGLDILAHYSLIIDWNTNPKQAIALDRP